MWRDARLLAADDRSPETIRAQIQVACAHYRMHFGRDPRGIWLPECGYAPGIEKHLAAEDIRYFFVDAHGAGERDSASAAGASTRRSTRPLAWPPSPAIRRARCRCGAPSTATRATRSTASSTATSARTSTTSTSSPYIQADRRPRRTPASSTTASPARSTSAPRSRTIRPPRRQRADVHAGNFLFNREQQIEYLQPAFGDGRAAADRDQPYDAELYGHWWFEGPMFLDFLIRKVAYDQDVLKLATPVDYLAENPEHQLCAAAAVQSWGDGRLRGGLARRRQRLDLPPPAQGAGADDRAGARSHQDASGAHAAAR